MKNAYTRAVSTPTPQTEQADTRQVKNNAGGFVFQVANDSLLDRFLILGTETSTYYQSSQDLTKKNVDFLVKRIKSDGAAVVSRIVNISDSGRAYKNSPAIFALALVFKYGSDDVKPLAKAAVLKVCRTATHIFELAEYFEALGGWSRARRTAVADWYNTRSADEVAFQAVKYRQRNGWTHRDLFRLAHPKGVDKNVGNFILGKETEGQNVPPIIAGFKFVQESKTLKGALIVLDTYKNLPWEALPTQFLKDADVWKKLFYNGQLKGQALVRNITRLARVGAFNDMVFARDYATRLTDEEMIRKTRLHPITFLNALVVYTEGQIDRKVSTPNSMSTYRKPKDWATESVIVDALNEGFHKAFKYAEPAGKRTLIALDISGSMDGPAAGLELTCAQVAGAMAMTIAKTEPYYMVRGFASGSRGYGYYHGVRSQEVHSDGLVDLGIAPSMGLMDVLRQMRKHTMGGTDCSLPMEWAIKNKAEIDTFLVITDNETWAGARHPHVALEDYRKKSGINARLVVVGVNATEFTIADPADQGMLDVVGGDANLPRLIADFSAGRM